MKKNFKSYLYPAVIAAAAFLIYLPSLFNGFAFDDNYTIRGNSFVWDIRNIGIIFSPHEYFIKAAETSYRPVATASYFLTYFFSKSDPAGFHLLSMLLHAINAVLVFLVARLIMKKDFYALLCALFFSVHPAASEAVFCISYNEDLFACLFILLSFYFYLKAPAYGFIISPLFFFIALLSKEMAITLPVLAVAYEAVMTAGSGGFNFKNIGDKLKSGSALLKDKFYYYLFFGAAAFVYLFLRFVVFKYYGSAESGTASGILKRIIFAPYNLFQFIKITLMPFSLCADYNASYPDNFFGFANLAAISVFAAVIVLIVILSRINKTACFGLLWFLITLLPVLNIILIFNPVAERFLYIPVIGFSLFAASFFERLEIKNEKINRLMTFFKISIAAVILAVYGAITLNRAGAWKDDEHLAEQTLKVNPKSYNMQLNMGLAYLNREDFKTAKVYFEKSNEITPNFRAYNNLGVINEELKEWDNAIANYKKAIEANPGDPWPYNSLGNLYNRLSRTDDAIDMFKKALSINPFFDLALLNMGIACETKNLINDAYVYYNEAIRANPRLIVAYNNLGVVYAKQGKLQDAIYIWQKGLDVDPSDQKILNNINRAKKKLTGGN